MYECKHLNQEVIKRVVSYGFNADYVRNCLEQNKHNHVTTTYYLALKNNVQDDALQNKVNQEKLNRLIKKAEKADKEEIQQNKAKNIFGESISQSENEEKSFQIQHPQSEKNRIVSALNNHTDH